MRIRSSVHLNGRDAALQIYPALQETDDHQRLKLAAGLFFFEHHPTFEMGATHAALQGQDYWPDLLAVDDVPQVTLWVECGKTTLHKLEKVSRRFRSAKIIVLTAQPMQADQQAEEIRAAGLRGIDVWSFGPGEFQRWSAAAGERNDIVGESDETSLNLVINDQPFVTELRRAL